MKCLCECDSADCRELFEITVKEAIQIRNKGHVMIASTCNYGPGPADSLIEKRKEYSIYVES